MKIENTNKKQKGMTLIEITLVIAILLGLISVLFIGISAYKTGADNAKCILQLATNQKLAISYGNLGGLAIGDPAPTADLILQQYMGDVSDCPDATGAYTYNEFVPAADTSYVLCSLGAPGSATVRPRHGLGDSVGVLYGPAVTN